MRLSLAFDFLSGKKKWKVSKKFRAKKSLLGSILLMKMSSKRQYSQNKDETK